MQRKMSSRELYILVELFMQQQPVSVEEIGNKIFKWE